MNAIFHARITAKKYGGEPEEYMHLHKWIDSSGTHFGDTRHRALLHSTFGIQIGIQIFGDYLINSLGKTVPIKDVLEAHIVQDVGRVPTASDYLLHMKHQPWMSGNDKPKRKLHSKVIKL